MPINTNEFKAALDLAKPALAVTPFVPILTHLCFSGGWCTAYNDVAAISVRLPGDLALEMGLPGDTLLRLVASFSSSDLEFVVTE